MKKQTALVQIRTLYQCFSLLLLVAAGVSCKNDDPVKPADNSIVFDGSRYSITKVATQLNGYGIVLAEAPYGPTQDVYQLKFYFKSLPLKDAAYKVTTIQRAGAYEDEVGIEMRDVYDFGVHTKYYFSDGDGTSTATVKFANGKTSVFISDVTVHYTSGATLHEVKTLSARVVQP